MRAGIVLDVHDVQAGGVFPGVCKSASSETARTSDGGNLIELGDQVVVHKFRLFTVGKPCLSRWPRPAEPLSGSQAPSPRWFWAVALFLIHKLEQRDQSSA